MDWRVSKTKGRLAIKKVNELTINLYINMTQLCHPNLLQFIGSVLDHPSGNPMIITEIMDILLCDA